VRSKNVPLPVQQSFAENWYHFRWHL